MLPSTRAKQQAKVPLNEFLVQNSQERFAVLLSFAKYPPIAR